MLTKMQVTYRDSVYVAECQYEEKDEVKSLGFQWNPTLKIWWTKNTTIISQVESKLSSSAWTQYQTDLAKAKFLRDLSSQSKSDATVIPSPKGEEYLPFQKVGVLYCIHQKNVLLADDPGLGKTIQSAGVINYLQETENKCQQVLVICPASLKINWKRELDKWLVKNFGVHIVGSNCPPSLTDAIQIINFDVLRKYEDEIKTRYWDLLIVDEAHLLKNQKAQRSRIVLGYSHRLGELSEVPINAGRKLYLTGTPMLNGRPQELWPLIHSLDPDTWPKFKDFALDHCDAKIGKNKKLVIPPGGASNLKELQQKLRSTIMVRRLKADVLTELPPKRRQVIELPADGCEQVILEELKAFEQYKVELVKLKEACEKAKASADPEEYKKAIRLLRSGTTYAFSMIAKMRVKTALAKMPMLLAHLDELVNEEKLKVVVFAHHHVVLNAIKDHFGDKAVMLSGETHPKQKQEAVDRFQNDKKIRVFVGSIKAAGVGITVTVSDHVVFAELDWVPTVLSQAEDRCHRIGQLNSVLVQHLVLEKSLDATMCKRLIEKQAKNDAATNIDAEETVYD